MNSQNIKVNTDVYVEGNINGGNVAGGDINIQYGVPQKVVDMF